MKKSHPTSTASSEATKNDIAVKQNLSWTSNKQQPAPTAPITAVCSCMDNVKIKSPEVTACIDSQCRAPKEVCRDTERSDRLKLNFNDVDMGTVIHDENFKFMKKGGWWNPTDCYSNHHVAIIIPMRDRYQQLAILLRHLLPLLKEKNKHFRVFVIEQSEKYSFNKGKLLNIGFQESLKFFPFTCFVFHDVDLMAESPNVAYGCEESPVHVSALIDVHNYKLLYPYMMSGVQMFTKNDYEKVNGFSNSFWHKGGEDDIMFDRIKEKHLSLTRDDEEFSKFTHLDHEPARWSGPDKDSPFEIDGNVNHKERGNFFQEVRKQTDTDGLNSLVYKVIDIDERPVYTNIRVDLQKELSKEFGIHKYGVDDLWSKHLKKTKK